jgi:dolichyl-phosphate-mannose--protein O-mannosyl transferase
LKRGVPYWISKAGGAEQIYFIGNVFVWWTSFAAVLAYPVYLAASMMYAQRKIRAPMLGAFYLKIV